MRHEKLLMIFMKNPRPGKVKTRLARDIGEQKALNVYQQLLEHTRKVSQAVRAERQLWYSDFINHDDEWPESVFKKKLQAEGDLGEKMKAAFRNAFSDGFQKVVIIGSDCLEIHSGHIERAFQALEGKDLVLGPADDGGYYLLGMNRLYPELFDDKDWSTPDLYQQTLDTAGLLSLDTEELERLNDVDTLKDLF